MLWEILMDSGLSQRDKTIKINRETLLTLVRSECTTTKNADETGHKDYERTTRKKKQNKKKQAIEILQV
jgi:hypothetical protein